MRDLNAKVPGAPNFRYYEFIKSYEAERLGIENIPNEEQWQNLEKLAVNILQPVRKEFGPIRISSGFRSAKLNKAVKGSSSSNHCRGQAADIEPVKEKVSLLDIGGWIAENLEFRELIFEYMPNGWIHVAYRENFNDKIIKLKDKKHHYTKVNLEYVANLYL